MAFLKLGNFEKSLIKGLCNTGTRNRASNVRALVTTLRPKGARREKLQESGVKESCGKHSVTGAVSFL